MNGEKEEASREKQNALISREQDMSRSGVHICIFFLRSLYYIRDLFIN